MLAMIRALIAAGARIEIDEWKTAIRVGDREVIDVLATADPEGFRAHGV